MTYLNPHELVGNKQYVFWGDFVIEKPITLELIDYFSAPINKKARGLYVVYYAISRSDYPDLGIKEDDELIVFLSYNTFLIALKKLPLEMKNPCLKKYAEGKNLLIKIERLNSTRMRVLNQEIREPTIEQLEEAKKQYAQINKENEYFGKKQEKKEEYLRKRYNSDAVD